MYTRDSRCCTSKSSYWLHFIGVYELVQQKNIFYDFYLFTSVEEGGVGTRSVRYTYQ